MPKRQSRILTPPIDMPGISIRQLGTLSNALVAGVHVVAASGPADMWVGSNEHALNLLLAGETTTTWEGTGFRLRQRLRPGQLTLVPASAEPYHFSFDGTPKTLRIPFAPAGLTARFTRRFFR
jgi:hypothetical protein